MAAVHVVGAGLAGLAAAVRLAERGQPVTLYEAAQHAGGRCRSFFDRTLGRVIDNGNHLLVSGNRSALAYLDAIGASEQPDRTRGCELSVPRPRDPRALDGAAESRTVAVLGDAAVAPRAGHARWRLPGGVAAVARR